MTANPCHHMINTPQYLTCTTILCIYPADKILPCHTHKTTSFVVSWILVATMVNQPAPLCCTLALIAPYSHQLDMVSWRQERMESGAQWWTPGVLQLLEKGPLWYSHTPTVPIHTIIRELRSWPAHPTRHDIRQQDCHCRVIPWNVLLNIGPPYSWRRMWRSCSHWSAWNWCVFWLNPYLLQHLTVISIAQGNLFSSISFLHGLFQPSKSCCYPPRLVSTSSTKARCTHRTFFTSLGFLNTRRMNSGPYSHW